MKSSKFKEKYTKIKEKVKFDLNAVLLTACVGKMLVLGSAIPDAMVIISLVSLYGYQKFLKSKEPQPLNDMVREELEDVKSKLSTLVLHKSVKPNQTKYKW